MTKYFACLIFLSKLLMAEDFLAETYSIDLNNDEQNENILLSKRQGQDVISITSPAGQKYCEHVLTPIGHSSKVEKITQIRFSESQQCLLINYFEGITGINGLKKTKRLYSLCYLSSNLSQISLQDLGYVFWDQKAVSGYEKLQHTVALDDIVINGDASTLVLLQDGERNRSWTYNLKQRAWTKFPERRYAQYGIKPAR